MIEAKHDNYKRLLTADELAAELGIHVDGVNDWVERGVGPRYMLKDSQPHFPVWSVLDWISGGRKQ